MNPFQNVEIKNQQVPRHHFPMQAPHQTTCNFMEFQPTLAFELIPDSSGTLDVKSFTRLDPVAAPCMGQANMHNRAFFVRYASVFRPFYDFITDTPHTTASGSAPIPTYVPLFSYEDYMSLLRQYGTDVTGVQDSDGNQVPFDFVYGSQFYALNITGRRIAKVFYSLGYPLINSRDVSLGGLSPQYVSALPILCAAKIYLDWYYPSAYAKLTSVYVNVESLFKRESVYTLNGVELGYIMMLFGQVNYDADYFTSAWDNPVAPNNGAFSSQSLVDISLAYPIPQGTSSSYHLDGQGVSTTSNGTPALTSDSATSNTNSIYYGSRVTQYQLSLLSSMQQYMRRHAIAGARSVDRWLADYGLALRADKIERSIYLGLRDAPIQFGDVMSHADTSTAPLGGYAGKGVGFNTGKPFEFNSGEDYGMLIVISSIVPSVGYVQGILRHILHTSRFDFHQGLWDGKGTQPIVAAELFTPTQQVSFESKPKDSFDKIFGFTQRYAEYKYLPARMSGDFMFPSVNNGLDSWNLFRLFDENDFGQSVSNVSHSINFVQGSDHGQYNRIFNITDYTLGDAFKVVHWFDLQLDAPMLPMYDDYVFHDAEGQKITVDSNGVKVN